MSMGINGVNNDNASITRSMYAIERESDKNNERLASGKRINSAADDAAGLAISENLESQIKGLEQGTSNTVDMQSAVKTAEGGLSEINDGLQRMRELAVQASNGTLTDEDKSSIQTEIEQLKSEIQSATEGTEFNTMNLLDGSFADKNTASNPSGNGIEISIENTSLETLGVADFDVTEDFSLDTIDAALSSVADASARIGANINAMDSTIASNNISSVNQSASKSAIADTDMGSAVSKAHSAQAVKEADILMQQKMLEQQMQMGTVLL